MKSFSRHIPLACLLGALTLAASAQAQDFKAGFVNTDRIFREANSAKAAQSKLEQEFSHREKDLVDQGNALKADTDKFERDAPTMAESQRTTLQRQLADRDRDFQRKRREFQEDLSARKNEELSQVLERANRVVKQIAEAEKYDVILQEAVYVNPKNDITDKVIKAMNSAPDTGGGAGSGGGGNGAASGGSNGGSGGNK
jgi:outer membrane protein